MCHNDRFRGAAPAKRERLAQLRNFRSSRHPATTVSPFRTNAIKKSATFDAWLLALKM